MLCPLFSDCLASALNSALLTLTEKFPSGDVKFRLFALPLKHQAVITEDRRTPCPPAPLPSKTSWRLYSRGTLCRNSGKAPPSKVNLGPPLRTFVTRGFGAPSKL